MLKMIASKDLKHFLLILANFGFLHKPIRGTASDVVGIDSATKFKNTVNDSRIVTPVKCFTQFRFVSFSSIDN